MSMSWYCASENRSIYCSLDATRRRYLTVQGPFGHTNKLCRPAIREEVTRGVMVDSRYSRCREFRRAEIQGAGRV